MKYRILVMILCAVSCFSSNLSAQNNGANIDAGDLAPDFSLEMLHGEKFQLSKRRGQVVLVSFFATQCPQCLLEMPHLEKLYKKYSTRKDFQLLVIGRNQDAATVKAFIEKHGYTFPVAADPDGAVFQRYAKKMIPRNYLIGRDGKVIAASLGFSKARFEKLVKDLRLELEK